MNQLKYCSGHKKYFPSEDFNRPIEDFNKCYDGLQAYCRRCNGKVMVARPIGFNKNRMLVEELVALRKHHPALEFTDRTAYTVAADVLREAGFEIEARILEAKAKSVKSFLDEEGNVVLNEEQKRIGAILGILGTRDLDPAATLALDPGDSGSLIQDFYRQRKKTIVVDESDLTKNELVLKAIEQKLRCIIHGGPLGQFYRRGKHHPIQLETEQLHIPSKAALRDAGKTITKDGIYAGCHVCNSLMTDAFGLRSINEVRPIILAEAARRKIRFLAPESVGRKIETTTQEVYYEIENLSEAA